MGQLYPIAMRCNVFEKSSVIYFYIFLMKVCKNKMIPEVIIQDKLDSDALTVILCDSLNYLLINRT